MQEASDRIRRREFLRMSGVGVAAAGLHSLLPGSLAEAQPAEPTGTRTAPAHPIVLRSSQLEVTLDGADALPYEYRWIATGARLHGEGFGQKMTATVCQRDSWRFFEATVEQPQVPHSNHASEAHFRFTIRHGTGDSAPACASFTLQYALAGATLKITLDDSAEQIGHELLEVAMPRLVTAREED